MALGVFRVCLSNYMNKHERPETYRVVFRAGNWVTMSERYYTVYHSSEALKDIYHALQTGQVHSKKIKIHRIEEYNRYSHAWEDRTEKALNHAEDLDHVKVKGGKIIIRRVANGKS